MDLGRTYEAIIRVNSQSGKGGVAYLMERDHHLKLPRGLQVDLAARVQQVTDATGEEVTADDVYEIFRAHYLTHTSPYELLAYTHSSAEVDQLALHLLVDGEEHELQGTGNGPIAALVDSLERSFGVVVRIRDYEEHAMSASADALAAAYVEAEVDDEVVWGVGIHASIATASLRAVVNAVNRALAARQALAEVVAAFD
jgi:2-isopropylmalate synthase